MPGSLSFDLPPASKEDTNKIVKSLNVNKTTGPDGIPLKLIKLSANFVDKYLTSIINHDISRSYFSDGAKNALVKPIHKKKYRQNKESYRSVSILNGFSKVHERFINDSMLPITQNSLRLCFSLQETLQCKPRTKSVNINSVHSMFQILLSGVSQGSILGPSTSRSILGLFNIFINDLFYFIKDAQLLNFADDNTIATFSNSVDDLVTNFQKDSENAIDWFCSNQTVVNPDKFQSIIINRLGKLKDSYELLIGNHKLDSENSVTVLGIEIDNKLNFEKHVTALCQKAGSQLNALSRIHKLIGVQEMQMLLDSFIFSNFSYYPLMWHFALPSYHRK